MRCCLAARVPQWRLRPPVWSLRNSEVTGNTGASVGGISTIREMTLTNSTVNCNSPDDIFGPFTERNSRIGPPGPC